LRIALILEFGSNFKKIDCLESWGIVKVVYKNVDDDNPWVTEWSEKLGLSPKEIVDGVCSLLDVLRRSRMFHDEQASIFSRYWREGDEEIQRGYLPLFTGPTGKPLGPKGIKHHREPSDSKTWVAEMAGKSGRTLSQDYLRKWPIPDEIRPQFLDAIWEFVANPEGALQPVELTGNRGNQLPDTAGSYQVSAQRMAIIPEQGRYRCNRCKRIHTRPTPGLICTAYRCDGRLVEEPMPEDNYDIQMLNLPFSMVAAHEHSAQVPAKIREKLEDEFKKPEGRYNCLVCTPTLELGVDIGDLDMVLMRNVPPTSANYWQRTGRAGRRFRMAVNYTYCRRSQHDEYFFNDPDQMLAGEIPSPRFNLRNEVMLRKHVHAAVLSEIIRLTRLETETSNLTEDQIEGLKTVIDEIFPNFIVSYLFDEGRSYRTEPPDVSILHNTLMEYRGHFDTTVKSIFSSWWPEEDREVVSSNAIDTLMAEMTDRLQETVARLHSRMIWAKDIQEKLTAKQNQGLLEQDEERILDRCRRYLKKLSQSSMDTYTLNVLAQEGFLPGYEVLDGSIKAFASRAFSEIEGRPDFELSRPPIIAVREFVPGNAIYANAGKYRVAYYHLPVGEEKTEPIPFTVNHESGLIIDASQGTQSIKYQDENLLNIDAIQICDAEIAHLGRISDEEQNRFQLPVVMQGYLKSQHRGGQIYSVADKNIQLRFGQEMRMVNLGPADMVRQGLLGFPVCTVCGAVRSPYASHAEFDHFDEVHERKCGKKPERIAFLADAIVDGLLFDDIEGMEHAVNLAEAIRIGATQILDTEQEDLQYLVWPKDSGGFNLFIYDPMSGGSGLLQQVILQWTHLCESSADVLSDCLCENACYKCMKTYRNLFQHVNLNRRTAIDLLFLSNSTRDKC